MSNMQYHDIVETTLAAYSKELEARILDGWQISPTNTGEVVGMYGGSFTISLFRNEKSLARLQERLEKVKERPKADRSAILANARAAKAAKKG